MRPPLNKLTIMIPHRKRVGTFPPRDRDSIIFDKLNESSKEQDTYPTAPTNVLNQPQCPDEGESNVQQTKGWGEVADRACCTGRVERIASLATSRVMNRRSQQGIKNAQKACSLLLERVPTAVRHFFKAHIHHDGHCSTQPSSLFCYHPAP